MRASVGRERGSPAELLGEGLDRALEQERHFQSTLFLTEDFAEGRAAFLGKRQPEFKGG